MEELAGAVSAGIELFGGEGAALTTAVVPNATRLSGDTFRESVAEVISLARSGLLEAGCPHPVRMWTFVPGIHDPMAAGLDRYRVFNLGRFEAFARWFGGPGAFERVLPAASAVGHCGDQLVVCVLGTGSPGAPLENPRQTPAFGYSLCHGPKPPCFARATLVTLPTGPRLLLSGTASIRGEDSLHPGDLEAQLRETLENIRGLLRVVPGPDRFSLNGADTARVYFPRVSDRGSLVAGVSAALPATAIVEYVPAKICRAELLVEIEATIAPSTAE